MPIRARTCKSWDKRVHRARVRRRLDRIESSYLDLVKFCEEFSKNPDTRPAVKASEWLNETHPGAAGFKKVTDKIVERMQPLLWA